ncbi:MAG: fasciclin domain-containing protein [Caulobacteraceae bacterium]|nr:fasciclin domain-containing protein [Caulobacteraceae bacterium]
MANGNLVSTLQGSGHFTILVKALDAANLSGTLKTTPELTLFAPTDEAFQALPSGQLNELLLTKNAALLQKVLTYHLVHLNLDSSKIKGAKGPVETVEKGKLEIDGSGDVLKVNDAKIIQADVHATNGYIQVVDKVLIPSDVTMPTASAAATPPAPPAS